MGKRGENIRKRKDGRWEARVKICKDGKQVYHSIYGHSYKEVKEKRCPIKSIIQITQFPVVKLTKTTFRWNRY